MKPVTSETKALTLWPDTRRDQPTMAMLSYDVEDPFAVELVFPPAGGNKPVSWLLARELLVDGLQEPTGEGDVLVAPAVEDGYVQITLRPEPDCALVLLASRTVVGQFLDRTFAIVPMGREKDHLNLDVLVAQLLGRVIT